MDTSQIGKRAWSYAGVLQDAGLSCFEYVEQLTLLLFLKMADQLTQPPWSREPIVPPELGWKSCWTSTAPRWRTGTTRASKHSERHRACSASSLRARVVRSITGAP